MEELAALDPTVLVLIGIVGVVQIALLIWALVDIVKRPDDSIRGGTKWPWVLLVLFLNLVGPVIYLAVGRVAPPLAEEGVPGVDADKTQQAVDTLYGENAEQ